MDDIHQSLQQSEQSAEADHQIPDERLKLIFTCCHPALSEQARVALTLRVLCGLNTREIARAYLISEKTLQISAKSMALKVGPDLGLKVGDPIGFLVPDYPQVGRNIRYPRSA